MTISRRPLLKAMLACSILPRGAWATQADPTDVVVIGAGAAGLAAARTLLEAGLSVRVVEASPSPFRPWARSSMVAPTVSSAAARTGESIVGRRCAAADEWAWVGAGLVAPAAAVCTNASASGAAATLGISGFGAGSLVDCDVGRSFAAVLRDVAGGRWFDRGLRSRDSLLGRS